MVQPLMGLHKLWSRLNTSVGELPIAIMLPVLEAIERPQGVWPKIIPVAMEMPIF